MTVVLRPSASGDRDFLARVYASTRADELAVVPFTDEQRAAFLAHQFAAQSVHFAKHYGDASFDIVEVDGEEAGRLIVRRSRTEIVVVDIALLPQFRGQGIGTGLMQAVLDEADAGRLKVTLQIESSNQAQRLYARLGFTPVGLGGVYVQMERVSVEDGFVAGLRAVARDRHQEDVELAERGVLERDDLLSEHGLGGTTKAQGESGASSAFVDSGNTRRVGRGLEQLEVQPKGVGMNGEQVTDERSEVVHVQAVEHGPDANRGFTRRRALQMGAVTALTAMWSGPSLARAATNSTPVYLRRSSYTGLVGRSFTIDSGSYKLAEVADLAGAAKDAALRGHDEAFVLSFEGSPGALETGIHNFSHPDVGSYSMFISPVDDADGGAQRYEAVVDRSVGRPADPPEPVEPPPLSMTVADKEAAAEELLASTSVHDIPGAPAAPARKRRPRRKSATTRMALRKVKRMEKAQRLTYERRARARKLALRRAKRRK